MLLTLPKAYFKSEAVTIQYDEELRLGMALWRGHLNSPDLREALLLCSYAIDRYGLTRWLADDRKMKAFSQEDSRWIEENLVLLLLASSLRRMATLVSEDASQVAAIELLVERAGNLHDLNQRNFSDAGLALGWLLEVE